MWTLKIAGIRSADAVMFYLVHVLNCTAFTGRKAAIECMQGTSKTYCSFLHIPNLASLIGSFDHPI